MTNAPERIWMPAGWEVLDGTIPVDAQADDDDIEYIRADLRQPKPTSELIKRAEVAAAMEDVLSDHVLPIESRPSHASNAKLIRDLIAALQSAPTAEQLRLWADQLASNWTREAVILELRAAADHLEGK